MSNIKITQQELMELYANSSEETQVSLRTIFGEETFVSRPFGFWIITEDHKALTVEAYEALAEKPLPIGVGVSTPEASFIVSGLPTVVLPFGAKSVCNYDAVAYDQDTYDNDAATDAIRKAHSGIQFNIWDDDRFPAVGAPAADYCPDDWAGLEWSLPTLATTKIISREVGNINAALAAAGLPVLLPGYHWTSTVNRDKEDTAFVVFLDYGFVDSYVMSYDYVVRAVSAFHFEDFDFNFSQYERI